MPPLPLLPVPSDIKKKRNKPELTTERACMYYQHQHPPVGFTANRPPLLLLVNGDARNAHGRRPSEPAQVATPLPTATAPKSTLFLHAALFKLAGTIHETPPNNGLRRTHTTRSIDMIHQRHEFTHKQVL